MASQTGLRARKKQQTRRVIADTARRLFAERGFEQVTIAEIARAADVSDKTVFNYFPAKEDLYFDEDQAMEAGLARAIRERRGGESVLDACRRFYTAGLGRMAGQSGSGPLAEHARILAASPALQARGLVIIASGRPSPGPAALGEDLNRGFDLLATGLGDYGRRRA